MKFFFNVEARSYLRELADEFEESTNGVRIELNRLTKAGLLVSFENGKSKLYGANTKHPLFFDINNLVKKNLGMDVIEYALNNIGKLELAYIIGDYSQGKDSGIIDLVLVGDINKNYLYELIEVTEKSIKRKIRPLILSAIEFEEMADKLKIKKGLLLWKK